MKGMNRQSFVQHKLRLPEIQLKEAIRITATGILMPNSVLSVKIEPTNANHELALKTMFLGEGWGYDTFKTDTKPTIIIENGELKMENVFM
jgi:hypothetical protein